MSYRPSDWSPLAGADPVPGEPAVVATMARHYASTAQEIASQVARLERLADVQDWQGEAARKFASSAGDLAEELDKAHRRFADLATAVQGWVEPLTRAQEDSAAALREAKAAEQAAASTASSLLDGVPEPTDEQKAAQRRRSEAHGDAVDALAAARRKLQGALDELDDAADRVADGIDDAANHHADSRWDRFKGWVQDNAGVLKAIAEVAAWVATGLAVLALFLTSPVWGPIVAVVAIVAGVIALAAHFALAASGEGSWTDVAIDVFALATFGLGRIAIRGVRAGVESTKAAAALVVRNRAIATTLAEHAFPLRVAGWALRTRIPLGPLRGIALANVARIAGLADDAGGAAVRALHSVPLPPVSVLQAARTMDRELAEHLARLSQLSVLAPAEAAAAAARTQRLAQLFVVGAGVDVADKAATVLEWLGGPGLKPDIRWTIPSFDLPAPVVHPYRFQLAGQ